MRGTLTICSVVAAGALVAAASAATQSSRTAHVSVKAPGIGKALVEAVQFNVKVPKGATPAPLTAKVTNAAALGRGFFGVAISKIQKKPNAAGVAQATVYLVMFTGNLSASTAAHVQMDVGSPAGGPAETPLPKLYITVDRPKYCGEMKDWEDEFEDGNLVAGLGGGGNYDESLEQILPPEHGASVPEAFLDTMISFVAPGLHCPWTPEPPEPGGGGNK